MGRAMGHRPADWLDCTAHKLQSGDLPRLQAAAGIEVRSLAALWTDGMMCVTANEGLLLGTRPGTKSAFDTFARSSIMISVKTQHLQTAPDAANDHPTQEIETVIGEIGLMPVHGENSPTGACVLQHQPFACKDSVFLDPMLPKATDVVVAQQHMQAPLIMELMQQIEDCAIRLTHDVETAIFPELVTITNFDVGEPFLVVVLQHIKKELCIAGKAIGYTPISSMTITEENQA